MYERRATERKEIDEVAYIAGDGSSICCRVVNISPGGAAIEVPNPSRLRLRFKLMLETDRIIRECRLIWRSGDRIGVSFHD
ncbi:PilZ domain-containing protein [Bradyrhizobium sp. CCGUVB14]|uniref:PilZ domain-containing protein n=1 Tax=Bradyrhizobium sp. CCGUVB14 TaxID=2949628 RepID=UPI0020B26A47|nr:PilZ domain-containing protein [Bradyrhizobium sp. CCGUVB14]MCP3442083.1 PilZ domain-containing protein [Bradyrhizobium sp. CCGUVB14]